MWLRYLQDLYSLETLDTRFTVSAKTPLKEALSRPRDDPASAPPGDPHRKHADNQLSAEQNGSAVTQTRMQGGGSSNWNTPEFYFYFLVVGAAIPLMFKSVYEVSKETHPNYSKFAPLLSDGWIPGRKVDNSDAQYASFRGNLPYVFLVTLIHPLLRKAYDYICRADSYTQVRPREGSHGLTQGLSAAAAADARLEQRISFDVVFALLFIIALHGISSLKILLLLYANFRLAKTLPKQFVPAATWVFNITTLFANELFRGYPLATAGSWMFPAPAGAQDTKDIGPNWGAVLDGYGGLIPRWEVLFNITVLRLISFNLDYYWSLQNSGANLIEKKQLDASNLSERDRVSIPAKASDFSFRNYVAYILYSPLYLTGPIITFNDYISQLRFRAPSITPRRTALYAVRFLVTLLTMEVIIHFTYAVAISKASPAWEVYSPFQLGMLGYFNLHHIWLKLLLPWRFFRLWALMDGIDPPENMVRCMSDNYSALAFWRGWHRSFNRWIVRYIYIPLGGSGAQGMWGQVRAIANFLAVFTFVALWHDIQLRLLVWGWLVTLFVLPEITATLLFPARKWKSRPTAYRLLCGLGAVGNILMMMAANLVGFALGPDGLVNLVHGIIGSAAGVMYLACACVALFTGAQVMFEVREQELRQGIRMKC